MFCSLLTISYIRYKHGQASHAIPLTGAIVVSLLIFAGFMQTRGKEKSVGALESSMRRSFSYRFSLSPTTTTTTAIIIVSTKTRTTKWRRLQTTTGRRRHLLQTDDADAETVLLNANLIYKNKIAQSLLLASLFALN